MKPKVVFLTVAVLGSLLFGQTQTKDTVTHEVQGRSHMTKIKLGEDAKMMALPTDRERLQKLYRDVLGCRVTTKSDSFDLIQFGPSFFIGVVYDEAALKDADARKAIWLEIRTADPEALKQKILAFGVKQVEFWDKDHFYFQAPGGKSFGWLEQRKTCPNGSDNEGNAHANLIRRYCSPYPYRRLESS